MQAVTAHMASVETMVTLFLLRGRSRSLLVESIAGRGFSSLLVLMSILIDGLLYRFQRCVFLSLILWSTIGRDA